MCMESKKTELDDILILVSSFEEVGKITVFNPIGGDVPAFTTEYEFPRKLQELFLSKYPNWCSYKIVKRQDPFPAPEKPYNPCLYDLVHNGGNKP